MWCILPQHWSALPRRAACTHVAPKGSQLCWCKYILTLKLSFLGVQSFDLIPQRNLFCYKNNNFQLIIDGRWLASSLSMSWQRRKQDSHVQCFCYLTSCDYYFIPVTDSSVPIPNLDTSSFWSWSIYWAETWQDFWKNMVLAQHNCKKLGNIF